tara:strand:- start:50930 stop:51427 length:498 start_codon:yes stop_codon:yes gene_type:complete
MARVTVEDCVVKIKNRFELVLMAAQRARDIHSGAPLTLDRDNDKDPVVALREIADENLDLDQLRYELGHGRQFLVDDDEEEEENLVMIAAEEAWAGVTSAQEQELDSSDGAEIVQPAETQSPDLSSENEGPENIVDDAISDISSDDPDQIVEDNISDLSSENSEV